MTTVRALAAMLCVAACTPAVQAAQSWAFIPTAKEYRLWPEYCRVQYSWVAIAASPYVDLYPQATVELWRGRIGGETFITMHHYCAAMIWLQRIKFETDPGEKRHMTLNALGDASFTYERAEPYGVLYPNVSVVAAQAHMVNGEFDAAEAILKKAIEAQPTRTEAYGALSAFYRQQKKLSAAKDVLVAADKVLEGRSPEIQYNLGLINLDLGAVDEAVANARTAYALGYPLEGLKKRLIRVGRWPPPVAAAPAGAGAAPKPMTGASKGP